MTTQDLCHQYMEDMIDLRNEFFPRVELLKVALDDRDRLIRQLQQEGGNEGMIRVLNTGRKTVMAEIRAEKDAYRAAVSSMVGHVFPIGSFEARRDRLDSKFHTHLMNLAS